jgi:hypothetical protein
MNFTIGDAIATLICGIFLFLGFIFMIFCICSVVNFAFNFAFHPEHIHDWFYKLWYGIQ